MLGLDLCYFYWNLLIQFNIRLKSDQISYFSYRSLSVPFKDKKWPHLFLCKYSNLNSYWQEKFPGNFLVNPLMKYASDR